MRLLVAPLQGHTHVAFRRFHAEIYGSADEYVTPFLRIEHGDVRSRDVRDVCSALNEGVPVRPQIIFRDSDEFQRLVDVVKTAGYSAVDLNLGCPFPPQMHHGRGAAMISNTDCMGKVAELIAADAGMDYSAKIRLGATSPQEWEPLIQILNQVPLNRITVHPRTATQQYGGAVDLVQFERILNESRHPVVYNGDILTPADIDTITTRFPDIEGVMIGRGLLRRPSIIAEWADGHEWSRTRRIEKLIEFHDRLLDYYNTTLCGEAQILSHIKPFWEYSEAEIDHKPLKQIKKARTLAAYSAAVHHITSSKNDEYSRG